MSYENALRETETFVPPKDRGEATQGGSEYRVFSVRAPRELSLAGSMLGESRGILVVYPDPTWGDTWSAPRAWMATVRSFIDVRPALDPVSGLQARHRLQALRARAQEKGLLEVVPWPVESEEQLAERRETSEAMMGLQAESLYERD